MSDSDRLLVDLEREEREISRRRRRLHDRIDFAAASGAYDPASVALLDRLRAEEREVSKRRRELHARIDELRIPRAANSARASTREAALDISRTGAYAESMRSV